MKKKRLAFVTYCMLSGGAERVISILSNNLIEQYEVYIITLIDSPSFYKLDSKITLLHSTVKPKDSTNILEAINFNYKTYKSILAIFRNEHIDICIGFMTSNNILATLASKRMGIPVIISERNNPYLQNESTSSFWKILRRVVYPAANILVVQTQQIKTFYTPFIKKQNIRTIPNPINPDFDTINKIAKENIILNVGRLENQKGHDVLISAFAKSNLKDWKLYIIGEGSLRSTLTELIQQLNLNDKVKLLGRKENVADYYKKSKIFAFSSRFEGFPNALLEAMYFGLPCISTDCPTGPSELIKNKINGFLVPVNDIESLSKKIETLSESENLRASIGEEAQKSVEPYSSKVIVNEWNEIIKTLLNKKK